MQQQTIQVTDIDSRSLVGIIDGSRPRDPRDVESVDRLERQPLALERDRSEIHATARRSSAAASPRLA